MKFRRKQKESVITTHSGPVTCVNVSVLPFAQSGVTNGGVIWRESRKGRAGEIRKGEREGGRGRFDFPRT